MKSKKKFQHIILRILIKNLIAMWIGFEMYSINLFNKLILSFIVGFKSIDKTKFYNVDILNIDIERKKSFLWKKYKIRQIFKHSWRNILVLALLFQILYLILIIKY